MTRVSWSIDARVMVAPARTFRALAAEPPRGSVWVAIRRPLFLLLVLASAASCIVAGGLTFRLMLTGLVTWTFVPAAETGALAIVIGRRWQRLRVAAVLDAYFAGHGPWTVALIVIAAAGASLRLDVTWRLLTTVGVALLVVAIAWSILIDIWFFRAVVGDSARAAVRDVALIRLITWPLVFGLFAVPDMNLLAAGRELAEAVKVLGS